MGTKNKIYTSRFFRTEIWNTMSQVSANNEDCRGACLHEIEFIPMYQDSDASSDEQDDKECDDAFCNFVCQFISLDCPRHDKCMEQPCANYAMCGNKAPQWLLDTRGGLCLEPCDLLYGRVFEFNSFSDEEACPVCLDTGAVSVVYECGHMICAQCYRKAAFSEAATQMLKRCPICREECKLRTLAVMHPNLFD